MTKPTTRVGETNIYWETALGKVNDLYKPVISRSAIPHQMHELTLHDYSTLDKEEKEQYKLQKGTIKFVDNIVGMEINK